MGYEIALLRTLRKFTPDGQGMLLKFLKERRADFPDCFTLAQKRLVGDAEKFGLQNELITQKDSLNSILADFVVADTVSFSKMSRAEQLEAEVLSLFKGDKRIQYHILQGHLDNINLDVLHSLKFGKFHCYTGERITNHRQAMTDYVSQEFNAIDRDLRQAKKIKMLEGVSWQTKVDLMRADSDVKMFLTGNKPAVCTDGCHIRNSQSLAGKNIDVIVKSGASYCLLNRALVKEIIGRNKDIYCHRLGCSNELTVEQIYERLIETIGKKHKPGSIDDIYGLTLGYPAKSTCIHHLRGYANEKYGTNFNWGDYQNMNSAQIQDFKNVLLKALKEKDSPYANCSSKLMKELENAINQINGFSHSQKVIRNNESMHFIAYLSEPQEFARIQNYVNAYNRLHI